MAAQIDSTSTVTANSNADNSFSLPDPSAADDDFSVIIENDNDNQVYIVESSGDTAGIPVNANSTAVFSGVRQSFPKNLYASSNSDVDVTVIRGLFHEMTSGTGKADGAQQVDGEVQIKGADDIYIEEEQLDTSVSSTDVGVLSYGDRALVSVGQDELRTAIGDESNVVTQSSPGTNDNALNYISGILNELQSVLDVDDTGIGDETNVVTQSTPGTNDNLLNYVSGLLSELQGTLTVQEATLGDETSVTSQQTAGTADNILNYLSGQLQSLQDVWVSVGNEIFQTQEQQAPLYEDVSNEVARVLSPINRAKTTGQSTTNSYADLVTLTLRESDGGTSDDTQNKNLVAVIENTGDTNDADFKLEGRINDGTDTSSWYQLEEKTNVTTNTVAVFESESSEAGEFDEVLIQTKSSETDSSTTVDGYLKAVGA